MVSKWLRSLAWESCDGLTRLFFNMSSGCFGARINGDGEVTGVVPKRTSGFKIHRTKGEKDQWSNSNTTYNQTGMILCHMSLLKS
ncbi:hypothetical protein TNCV_3978801 [Trichonephila clavipes]|uniref:Uncharacterized protein n=1 Tax=Trichonephila clavipes TaxID=2585209 RepID=A0A8X6WGL4_TRICX|nr:hypothetical protein TNCV_3978801 [Trichonephila clavipes]